MKKLEDISTTFVWDGREVTAWGDCDYDTHKVDLGPEGHRKHCFVHVPCDMSISRLQVAHGDKDIENPDKNLLQLAERLLLEEADAKIMYATA